MDLKKKIKKKRGKRPLYSHQAFFESPVSAISSSENVIAESSQCRICLQHVKIHEEPIFARCGCLGSLRYVHQSCYKDWVQRTISQKSPRQKNQILINGFKCQLCQNLVELRLQPKLKCRSWAQINSEIHRNGMLIKEICKLFIAVCALLWAWRSWFDLRFQIMCCNFINFPLLNWVCLVCWICCCVILWLKDYVVTCQVMFVGFKKPALSTDAVSRATQNEERK